MTFQPSCSTSWSARVSQRHLSSTGFSSLADVMRLFQLKRLQIDWEFYGARVVWGWPTVGIKLL